MRNVIANAVVSLDGYTAGPDPYDMSWLIAHAIEEHARAHWAGIYTGATTALLGRKNFEGFSAYWPPLADDPTAHPRDRAYAQWQNAVEKVVFSRTLTEVPGPNARLAQRDLVDEVAALRAEDGGDIIVLSSASIVHALLEADLVDVLHLKVVPVVLGGGMRFWPDGAGRTDWALDGVATFPTGALNQIHRRAR